MKIAHIFWGLGTGGIETMLVNIANEQARLGHEVHIIIINDLVNETLQKKLYPEVHFICLKRVLGSKSPWPVIKLNCFLLIIRPDIIHFHEVQLINYVFQIWRNKSVLTVHDVLRSNQDKGYSKFRQVYAISDSVRDDMQQIHRIDAKTIFNGIPVRVFHQRKEKKKVVNLIQVSRIIHEKKGQDILLQAFSNLVNKGYRSLTLTFVGEGESESYLRNMAKELGVENRVHFAGLWQQEYLFTHLAEFDLFVQPSRYEGFGLTVAEAMAAKVPVLVSANQGPMEIIGQGKYGYSFENGNVDDCMEKLQWLITNGIDLDMIENAYRYVNQMFDVRMTAKRYIEEYKAICSNE